MPINLTSIADFSPHIYIGVITAIATGIIGLIFFAVRAWLKKREMRPLLRVNLSIATINYAPPAYLAITAENIGYVEVILSSVGIITSDNEYYVFPFSDPINSTLLPLTLPINDSFTRYILMRELETYLKGKGYQDKYGIKINLTGFFKDKVGNEFKSNPKEYEMNGW